MSSAYNSRLDFTHEDVLKMLATVHSLINEISQAYNQYDNKPAPNSLASQELQTFPNQELIQSVHYGGILSMESAGDHLMVFADSIAEPAKTIAPWTCVRGLLESCALATWFLDHTIDAKTRVGRYFAFCYSGYIEQIKYLEVEKIQAEITKTRQRVIKVEQDAVGLGYPRLLNKNGNIIGIGQHMPTIIELIGQTLNREADYRLLSGVAHGHHWATLRVGFRVIEVKNAEGKVTKALQKHLHLNFIIYVANIAVTSFAKVIWYLWHLYGWKLEEVEHLLETTYDQLNYKDEVRFWRSKSNIP
jgi:hypothetical protein